MNRAKKVIVLAVFMLLITASIIHAAAESISVSGFFSNYIMTSPIETPNGGSGHFSASYEMGGISQGDRLSTDIIAVDVQTAKVEIEWMGMTGSVVCDEDLQWTKASVTVSGGLWESSYSAVHRVTISKDSIFQTKFIQAKR